MQSVFLFIHSCQHSCSVVVTSPVEGDTGQGSNPGGKKVPRWQPNPKNNGRALACSFYNWFGPSYQGVVAVITSPEGYGRPSLLCDLIRWSHGSVVFSISLTKSFFLVQYHGTVFPHHLSYYYYYWPVISLIQSQFRLTCQFHQFENLKDATHTHHLHWDFLTPDGNYSTRLAYRAQFRGSFTKFRKDLIWRALTENKCKVFT